MGDTAPAPPGNAATIQVLGAIAYDRVRAAPDGKTGAGRTESTMRGRLWWGLRGAAPMIAFPRADRPADLVRVIVAGQSRRSKAIGVGPMWGALPVGVGPLKSAG